MTQLRIAREFSCLNVDAAMDQLSPQQWDELIAAENIEPIGERRQDLRIAYLTARLLEANGAKQQSVWDVYDHMRWLFAGNREDDPVDLSTSDTSRMMTGK